MTNKQPPGNIQYRITTPNPRYKGGVCGLRFNEGQAILSEFTLNQDLGRTLEETAKMLSEEFGYEVVKFTASEVVEEVLKPASPHVQMLTSRPTTEKPKVRKRIVSANPKQIVEVEVGTDKLVTR